MSEIHAVTGSYPANALDQSELEEFEAHLAVCSTCSREIVEFCQTAAELTLLASAAPPPALKSSVMSAISRVRVLPPEPAAEDEVTTVAAVHEESAPQAKTTVAPVDELALRRQRRLTRVLSLAVAAALVVARGLGSWVVSLTQRETPVATSTLETQLLSAQDMKA